MKKKQYKALITPLVTTITTPLPLAKEKQISWIDTYLSQNDVATQYNKMTPSGIAYLVREHILIPRYVIHEDNSQRTIRIMFASADVDYVASMRTVKHGWDYAGLSEYWGGRLEAEFPEGVVLPIDNPAILRELILESLRQALKLSYIPAFDEMTFEQALLMASGVVSELEDIALLEEIQVMLNDLTAPTPTKS